MVRYVSHYAVMLTSRFARKHKEGEVVGQLQQRQHYDRASKELHILRQTIDRSRLNSLPMPKLWRFDRSKPTLP